MARVVAVRDPDHAPVGWLVCRLDGDGDFNSRDESTTLLVDHDFDLPGLARHWGYVPCECGTDGTTDCPHKKAGAMIAGAWDYLEEHGTDPIDDPGYFAAGDDAG